MVRNVGNEMNLGIPHCAMSARSVGSPLFKGLIRLRTKAFVSFLAVVAYRMGHMLVTASPQIYLRGLIIIL